MADFKIPNLCGASPEFNAIQTKFESLMKSAVDGLEVDASALKATLDTDVTALVSDLKAMIPELPELPNINLQAQLTSLSGLSIGSSQYNILLAGITTKFGSALTASGFSLDTLVSDARKAITDGGNLCDAIPNFEVDAAGVEEAAEKAIGVLQPAVDSLPEKISTLVENPNVTQATTNASTVFNTFFRAVEKTGTLPTVDEGSYTVTKESTEVVVSSQGQGSKLEVTTPADQTYKDGAKTKKKNISPKGITTQTYQSTQDFTDLKEEAAWSPGKVGFLDDGSVELRLNHVPLKILRVLAGITKIAPKGEKYNNENFAKWEYANNSNITAAYHEGDVAAEFQNVLPPNTTPSRLQTARGVIKDTWTVEEPGYIKITTGNDKINGHLKDRDGKPLDEKEWVTYRIIYSYNSNYDPN